MHKDVRLISKSHSIMYVPYVAEGIGTSTHYISILVQEVSGICPRAER